MRRAAALDLSFNRSFNLSISRVPERRAFATLTTPADRASRGTPGTILWLPPFFG